MLLKNSRYGAQHVEFARGGDRAGTDLGTRFLPVSSGLLWGGRSPGPFILGAGAWFTHLQLKPSEHWVVGRDEFFPFSSSCPFFLVFSFSDLVTRDISKHTGDSKRDWMSLSSASVIQAYEMMLKGRPLEMELLAMAFYRTALLKKERDLSVPTSPLEQMCALFRHWMMPESVRESHSLSAFFFPCTWCVEEAWTPDLSGVFSSASSWVISSVLSPLRKGFLDLFVLAVAVASTSESSISWIPRSPRRKPSNTNSSGSHFRTGVGRELRLALRFHWAMISTSSILPIPAFCSQNWLILFLTYTISRCSGFLILPWLFAWFHHQPHSGYVLTASTAASCTTWKKQMLPCENTFVINETNPWSQRRIFTCDCCLL